MANPNIVSTTSVKGNTVVLANITADSPVTLIINTVSNSIYKIGTLIISNTNTTTPYDVTAQFVRSSTTYALANTVSIPPDTSLVLLSRVYNSKLALPVNFKQFVAMRKFYEI